MGSVPFVTCMHRATQASVTPKPPVSSLLLLRQLNKCPKAFGSQSRRRCKRAASQPRASTAQQAPASAKVAVEQGLEAFANGDTTEALRLFRKGLSMNPSKDEARAALYNMACCLVKEKKWQAAADAVSDACNNYGLKYAVALKDPDLRQLRERREWLDATENIKGAVSKASLVELRSEAKAPFRLIRMFLTLGAGAAAVVSLGITLYALKGVLQGGKDAPELNGVLLNVVINGAGIAGTSWLFQRDLKARQRDRSSVEREEALARLQVRVGSDRVVPVAKFRGSTRPVLIAGSKGQISRTLQAAKPFISELRLRGVSVIPLESDAADFTQTLKSLKQEFKSSKAADSKGFGAPKPVQQVKQVSNEDKKWQLEAYETAEWLEWLEQQKKTANVKGDHVFVQIQLDGTVRSSGIGSPPWEKFLSDLAPLDDLRTRFTDGMGRSQ
ncbi:TPA: hypothetical protein ACH3X3_014572 [Trebouxia sp. C0006]